MIKQLIIGKIKKCCDDAIDCYDDCMFFSEEYDECIFRVLGLGSPAEWERHEQLAEWLIELKERREQEDKEDEERSLEVERDELEREN